MFDKVKIILRAFLFTVLIAAAAAGVEFSSAIDWTGFGVFGPAIGLAVGSGGALLLSFLKKEYTGYGTADNPKLTKDE